MKAEREQISHSLTIFVYIYPRRSPINTFFCLPGRTVTLQLFLILAFIKMYRTTSGVGGGGGCTGRLLG
jgi:hypothetical protein